MFRRAMSRSTNIPFVISSFHSYSACCCKRFRATGPVGSNDGTPTSRLCLVLSTQFVTSFRPDHQAHLRCAQLIPFSGSDGSMIHEVATPLLPDEVHITFESAGLSTIAPLEQGRATKCCQSNDCHGRDYTIESLRRDGYSK